MKTRKSFSRQLLVSAFVLLFGVFVFSACKKDNNNNNNTNTNNKTFSISGSANSSQVVPALTDTLLDSSSATITGTYSQSTNQLITTTNWSHLSGAPTSGGFYSGATGVNGTLIGSAWTLGTGLSGTGSFNDTLTLSADQATALTTGNWYYSLGTALNPSGEVRGQITATAQ